MKLLEGLIIAVFGVVCLLFVWLVSDGFGQQPQRRDALRRQHLEQIMTRVTTIYDTLPSEPKQIGSAKAGCQLQTNYCQVTLDSCFDVAMMSVSTGETIVSDITQGTIERSGYMIRLLDPHTVELTACYPESNERITLQKNFPDRDWTKVAIPDPQYWGGSPSAKVSSEGTKTNVEK